MNTTVIFAGISVIIAAASFIWGIFAWRKEFIGKRKIELVEKVLALFYQARDSIRYMRNIVGYEKGKTRKQYDSETEEESKFLDQEYTILERYKSSEEVFAELNSLKYRIMASFDSKYSEPFNEINFIVMDILAAAHMIRIYQQNLEEGHIEDKSHILEEIKKYTCIRWYLNSETDEIENRLDKVISEIEDLTKEVVNRK